MKKVIKGFILTLCAIILTTTAVYGMLLITKQTDTITVKTATIDMNLGTPTIDNSNPLAPGEYLYIKIPVTNPNTFKVTISSVIIKNLKWYEADGTTLAKLATNSTQMTIQKKFLSFKAPATGTTIATTTIAPGTTEDLWIPIYYSSSQDTRFMDKTIKFNLELNFAQSQ